MKKSPFLLLLPAFVLALSVMVTGCHKTTEVPTQTSATTETTTAADPPTEATPPDEPLPPEENPEMPDEEQTFPDGIDDAFLGSFDGNTYSNRYIGIACSFGDDWQIHTSSSHAQFYDMQVQNTLNNASTHVVLTPLSQMEQAAYANASDGEIADIVLLNSDSHAEAYAQAGMTVKSMTKATFTFLGQERYGVYTVCDLKGVDYHIVQLFRYNLGPCGATITAAGFSEDTVRSILAGFYAI